MSPHGVPLPVGCRNCAMMDVTLLKRWQNVGLPRQALKRCDGDLAAL
jgi:hypothetical protein